VTLFKVILYTVDFSKFNYIWPRKTPVLMQDCKANYSHFLGVLNIIQIGNKNKILQNFLCCVDRTSLYNSI